jgi:hypothetical protein
MVRPPPLTKILLSSGSHLNVGEWVEVEHCYSVGTCSDGGVAMVTKFESGKADVRYFLFEICVMRFRPTQHFTLQLLGKTTLTVTLSLNLSLTLDLTLTIVRQHMAKEALSSALSARRQSSFVTLALVYILTIPFQYTCNVYIFFMHRTMTTGVQRVLWRNIFKRLHPNPTPNTNPSQRSLVPLRLIPRSV